MTARWLKARLAGHRHHPFSTVSMPGKPKVVVCRVVFKTGQIRGLWLAKPDRLIWGDLRKGRRVWLEGGDGLSVWNDDLRGGGRE